MKILLRFNTLLIMFVFIFPITSSIQGIVLAQKIPDITGTPYTNAFKFTQFNSAKTVFATQLKAGGDFNVAQLNDEYEGYISERPDIKFDYTDVSDTDLVFYAEAENTDNDLIMLIFTPENEFYFADDTEEFIHVENSNTSNPEFTLENPVSGTYRVWIGNYDGIGLIDASFGIFEYSTQNQALENEDQETILILSSIDGLYPQSEETSFGQISLESGFEPDPFTKSLIAGGRTDLSEVSFLEGMVSPKPDFKFHYKKSPDNNYPLTFSVDSEEDTILLIYSESHGSWFFSDDEIDTMNPKIDFTNPEEGTYIIYVGTFSEQTTEAELIISER